MSRYQYDFWKIKIFELFQKNCEFQNPQDSGDSRRQILAVPEAANVQIPIRFLKIENFQLQEKKLQISKNTRQRGPVPAPIPPQIPRHVGFLPHIPLHIPLHISSHISLHIPLHVCFLPHIPLHIPLRIPLHILPHFPLHIPLLHILVCFSHTVASLTHAAGREFSA